MLPLEFAEALALGGDDVGIGVGQKLFVRKFAGDAGNLLVVLGDRLFKTRLLGR